jgi:hypothetical protein
MRCSLCCRNSDLTAYVTSNVKNGQRANRLFRCICHPLFEKKTNKQTNETTNNDTKVVHLVDTEQRPIGVRDGFGDAKRKVSALCSDVARQRLVVSLSSSSAASSSRNAKVSENAGDEVVELVPFDVVDVRCSCDLSSSSYRVRSRRFAFS